MTNWTSLFEVLRVIVIAGPATAADVEVTIQPSSAAIKAGETIEFQVTATNRGASTVWTNPGFICTGSWDSGVRDPYGRAVRVDDRDAMGCPSGGLLTTPIEPGASTTLKVGWDGRVRPAIGKANDAPRGTYELVVAVRWGDQPKTPNHQGPHTFVVWARTSVMVESQVPPAQPPPVAKPPPPASAPAPPPKDDLRQLFGQFEPPAVIKVQTSHGIVDVSRRDYDEALASMRAVPTELTLPDVVMVEGVKVPYYAAWVAETDHGKKMGLSPWAKQQAVKYGVDLKELQAAVATDWTRQGQERDARLAGARAEQEQRLGASLNEVGQSVNTLRQAYEDQAVRELARKYGITNPRLSSWGPAGSGLGIAGVKDGEAVLLYQGKLYRGGERPPGYYNKCLPPEALIGTPRGGIALGALDVGDLVWTLDGAGRRVASPIVAKRVVPITGQHSMVYVTLDDGRALRVSAAHPSAAVGVTVGDWRVGDVVDHAIVVDRTVAEYAGETTQDILPAGETQVYWADGILIGSTLVTR